jgi:hypothetical protein
VAVGEDPAVVGDAVVWTRRLWWQRDIKAVAWTRKEWRWHAVETHAEEE